MNTKTKYFPQIDSLRFIAVFLVCINHWLPNSLIVHLQPGRLGVELFFVISGFLITRILINLKNQDKSNSSVIRIFYLRRVLRIVPAYYFVVFLSYIFHTGHFKEAIVWNLTYFSNLYILSINEFPGIMSHFWSLSVEAHFYLIWPILIVYTRTRNLAIPIILSVFVGIGSRFIFYALGYSALYPLIFSFSCFDAFAIGGLMAFLSIYRNELYSKIIKSDWLLIIIVFISISILLLRLYNPSYSIMDYVGYRFVTAIISIILIGKCIASNSLFLNNKVFVHLGKISYSMYLFHNFIPGFLLGVKFPENIYLRVILYFITLIAVSHISFKLIETPFNRLKIYFNYNSNN